MNIPQKHQAELGKICEFLREAVTASTIEQSHATVREALKRAERLAESIGKLAAKLGQKGGQRTAERGPEYFRRIAAMRKTKGGGRPRKGTKSSPTDTDIQ